MPTTARTLPDLSAEGTEVHQHCYNVVFEAAELWPEAEGRKDVVHLDLWESYLEWKTDMKVSEESALKPLAAVDGEPAFDEAWQAQVLAIADTLVQSGLYSASEWSQR